MCVVVGIGLRGQRFAPAEQERASGESAGAQNIAA
jgi:hypothetical protein